MGSLLVPAFSCYVFDPLVGCFGRQVVVYLLLLPALDRVMP